MAGSIRTSKNNSHVEPFLIDITKERKRSTTVDIVVSLKNLKRLQNTPKYQQRALFGIYEKNAGVAIVIAISSSRQRIR